MGYQVSAQGFDQVLEQLSKDYIIYAPTCFQGGGRFSGTDCIRYNTVKSVTEIVFDKKSEFSFKEIVTPIVQTLFYFTEDTIKEANVEQSGAIVFLRSCDLHAVKVLDDMYLHNGPEDHYYKRLRENLKFVLIGCETSFESCFCVDMGTNMTEQYDLSIDIVNDGEAYMIDCKWPEVDQLLKQVANKIETVVPKHVIQTQTSISIPVNLSNEIAKSSIWREYDTRCINCGRCNFVCPTCTCFTMQDLFYSENGKVGERRRVAASCMVDGYTNVAGGGNYRTKSGDRMRFKVLHKVLNYKERHGYHMCVGCGRCDDICPEYISFSNCINKLEAGMKEVLKDE